LDFDCYVACYSEEYSPEKRGLHTNSFWWRRRESFSTISRKCRCYLAMVILACVYAACKHIWNFRRSFSSFPNLPNFREKRYHWYQLKTGGDGVQSPVSIQGRYHRYQWL
jgi:hypothetical protein